MIFVNSFQAVILKLPAFFGEIVFLLIKNEKGEQVKSGVNNLSDKTVIIRAIEDNQAEFFKCYAKTAKGSVRHDATILLIKSGIPLRAFNGVFYNNFPAAAAENKIEEIKDAFTAEGLPFMWWITPSSRPLNLENSIEKHGLKLLARTPGMALIMSNLRANAPLSGALTVKKVGDEEEMVLWMETALQSFGIPLTFPEQCLELFNNMRLDKSCLFYLGYGNEGAVSVSLLFCGAATAGIYWVGTLASARNKGAGTAVTLQALLDARERGYSLATLKSSAFGFPVYKKLGFNEYCNMGFCVSV